MRKWVSDANMVGPGLVLYMVCVCPKRKSTIFDNIMAVELEKTKEDIIIRQMNVLFPTASRRSTSLNLVKFLESYDMKLRFYQTPPFFFIEIFNGMGSNP